MSRPSSPANSASAEAAAAANPPRRSARSHQEPVRLQSEQEGEALARMGEADLHAVLLLSMSDEAEVGDEIELSSPDSEEEEEEEEPPPRAGEHKSPPPPADSGWRVPPRLDPPPLLPRHPFPSEPLHLPPHHPPPTPLSFLQLFINQVLLNQWVSLTNQRGGPSFPPTDCPELLAFIGLHLFMGVDQLPSMRMYWAADTAHSTVSSLMTRDRFELLNRNFTVTEHEPDAAPRNPFSSVRNFVTALNQSFPHHWRPSTQLAIDESIVSFRGRSDIKQFVPGKPHPHGYKLWVLANENYVLHFQLYQGRAAAGLSIHDTVMALTAHYQHRRHVLFCDSLFTSPTLLSSLFNVGIRLCGTVKRNRQGMPTAAELPPERLTAVPRGEALQMQKGEANGATVCAWRDKKLILLLYNHCDPNSLTSLERWGDDAQRYQLPCPQAISDYFHFARAIDIINQLHYSYVPGRKSRKCSTRLVWWLIDVCILNAYRLWQTLHPADTHLQFRTQLMHELMEQLPQERRSQRATRARGAGAAPAHIHYSLLVDSRGDCVQCSRRPDHRVTTSYICAACNTHLCIGNCFASYHS